MYPGEPCTDISTGKGQSVGARRREKREKGKCRVRVEPVACFIMQKLSRLLDTRSVLCVALYHYNLQPTTNSSTSTLALALEQRRGGGKSLRPESRKYRQPFCDKLFSATGRKKKRKRSNEKGDPPSLGISMYLRRKSLSEIGAQRWELTRSLLTEKTVCLISIRRFI